MLPILLKVLGVAVGGLILKELFSDDEIKYNNMTNAHNEFLKFEQAISLTKARKDKLIASREALQKRIVEYFRKKGNVPIPKFYIQGSYKMGTMVRSKEGEYDVDLGVYFLDETPLAASTLKNYVFDAVLVHTEYGTENREKCIRVRYAGEFDIDLPVYQKKKNDKNPFLATRSGWQLSDPKELCDWFNNQRKLKDKNGQLLRLIKYFKSWANQRSRKMPNGIAFTVWVLKYYKPNERDDIAFYETAKAIKNGFNANMQCINPATPKDDFLARLDSNQKSNFKEAFSELIKQAEQALQQNNKVKALNIWKQQFGEKFPNAVN